jgi:hypothetical protein
MQMNTIIINIFRNRVFANSGDPALLACGMHWCLSDTKRLCGEIKP